MKKLSVSPFLVFVLCLSFYFGYGKITALVLLAATLHEIFHLAFMDFMKVKIKKVSLGITGAVIESEPMTYPKEIICAAVGPIANLLCVFLWEAAPVFSAVNLVLFLYNILPVYPLDGGRILRACLLLKKEEYSVIKMIHYINIVVCAAVMFAAVCFAAHFRWGMLPVFLVAAVLCRTGLLAEREGY